MFFPRSSHYSPLSKSHFLHLNSQFPIWIKVFNRQMISGRDEADRVTEEGETRETEFRSHAFSGKKYRFIQESFSFRAGGMNVSCGPSVRPFVSQCALVGSSAGSSSCGAWETHLRCSRLVRWLFLNNGAKLCMKSCSSLSSRKRERPLSL